MLSVVLAALLLTGSLCGCQSQKETVIEPMELEEVYSYSFDIIGGSDVMPLLGYWGPKVSDWSEDGAAMVETMNDETFQMIADAGVNIIEYTESVPSSVGKPVHQMLDFGEKYGIGIFVNDYRIREAYGENSISVEKMLEYMSDYMNHPAYAGMFLADEPGSERYSLWEGNKISYFPDLYDKLQRQIGTFTSMNLLPITDMERKDDYISYVEEYLETIKPTVLSYDKYPFETANRGREDEYFWNLGLMREYAIKHKIPLWSAMQCGDQWNLTTDTEKYWPNEGEFNWQVNTNLAFGTKGVQYYSLLEYPGSAEAETEMFDTYRSGLIGVLGNKTQWWYYAQKVNQHIASIDHILMNSVNKGVLATGKDSKWATSMCSDKTMLEGSSWRELADVKGDALVGCFNYQGKTALYVVNYSTEYAQNMELSFVDKYNVTVFEEAKASHYNAKELTLDMQPGEGILVVFE